MIVVVAPIMSAAEAQKLLDGTTPGPFTFDPDYRTVWAESTEEREPTSVSHDDLAQGVSVRDGALFAAAPNLAASVVALHDALAAARTEREHFQSLAHAFGCALGCIGQDVPKDRVGVEAMVLGLLSDPVRVRVVARALQLGQKMDADRAARASGASR